MFKKPGKQQKNYNAKITAERGNTVVIEHTVTKEKTDIKVTDKTNPFYMKQLGDEVSIKGEKYKVVRIKKPQF